jgi:sirohydrochlorin ferrochelatase
MSDALLIAAHGSRDPAGVEEFWDLARAWSRIRPDRPQAAGFLEFERPTISEAIDELVARGSRRIVVVPAMLMAAGHVKNDVPSEIEEGRRRHSGVTFHMARALDLHPALLELCYVRYREALEGRPEVPGERTLLLLVGRGTSDPDANANIARISRFLWESYGVGFATVAFTGLAAPGVDAALAVCRRLGCARIVVQPYLLFDGVLLKRIHETARRHAAAEPGQEIFCTGHLRLHRLLLDAFEDRAFESLHGTPHMNCDLCKYRVKLVGRELELGAAQVGHHYAVRADDFDGEGDHSHRPRRRATVEESRFMPEAHPWDERLLDRLRWAR